MPDTFAHLLVSAFIETAFNNENIFNN
jgi:hypothetical protein